MTHSPTKTIQTETAKIMADPMLSPEERVAKLRRRKAQLFKTKAELQNNGAEWEDLEETSDWAKGVIDDCRFGKVEDSALHRLAAGPINAFSEDAQIRTITNVVIGPEPTFLMQSDWNALISGTEATHGEWRFPADNCFFEFVVNSRRLIALSQKGNDRMPAFVEGRGAWWAIDYEIFEECIKGPQQIRALCILLEAEAIEAEVVRAPHKLNAARERRGKLPIYDHHILKLKERRRYGALEPSGNERASPRLHFRRGHWRHYQQHKVWVKWQLVGDASLGFVDKDYAY